MCYQEQNAYDLGDLDKQSEPCKGQYLHYKLAWERVTNKSVKIDAIGPSRTFLNWDIFNGMGLIIAEKGKEFH